MARRRVPPRKPPSKSGIKAAADRAEKRAKGEDLEEPKVSITPDIKPAAAILKERRAEKRKRKRGRPTKYTPAVGRAICKMLAAGMSVKAIGRRAAMPSSTQILAWGTDPKHPFSDHYARAREVGYLNMAEEVVDISDDGSNDWMERRDKEGEILGWTINGEAVARSKLRIDTRKWVLAKMLPKVYGEKTSHELSGPGGGPIEVSAISKLEIARWIADQLRQASAPQALTVDASGSDSVT